jgi:hypothetical protein
MRLTKCVLEGSQLRQLRLIAITDVMIGQASGPELFYVKTHILIS